jgi:hypothetical protein
MTGWRRWVARIGLGIIAFVILAFAVLFIVNPFILTSLLLSTGLYSTRPPPIADGVITATDWARRDVVNVKLTNALQSDFPVGTPEAAVKAVLLKQGFKPQGTSLEYGWTNGVCGGRITIKWTTDDSSKITGISGSYHGVCL